MDGNEKVDNLEQQSKGERPSIQDQEQVKQQMEAEQISEELQMLNEEIEMLQMEEAEIEQNSQKMMQKLDSAEIPENMVPSQPVKNPISPYLMFVKHWRKNHLHQKLSITRMGQLWRTLSPQQKQPHEETFRQEKKNYQEYQAKMHLNNPSISQKEQSQSKYLFPLHRIKSIIKQDSYYTPKAEAVAAFAKATEYFGAYLLDQVKKVSEGRGRVDSKHLYDCIGNQKTLFFLECLIEEHNKEEKAGESDKKVSKPSVILEMDAENEQQRRYSVHVQSQPKKKAPAQSNHNKSNTKMQAGQTKLTDMFVKKN